MDKNIRVKVCAYQNVGGLHAGKSTRIQGQLYMGP